MSICTSKSVVDCWAAAGMTEPISAGVEAGVRLGLGKQAQDDHYTAAENITRRKLEVEIQAEETADRKERREVGVKARPAAWSQQPAALSAARRPQLGELTSKHLAYHGSRASHSVQLPLVQPAQASPAGAC